MPDGKVEDHGSRDQGKPDCDDRKQCESEGNAVVEHPMPVKVDDPAFLLPRFHTDRTEVFPAQFYVTQCAQEPPAMVAWEDGFFLRMVIAARLVTYQRLPVLSRLKTSKK